MKSRLYRTKVKGQSLPLIGLMIVILVAMVGLAVDVGNTYAEQRNTERAASAAALAGMNTLIAGGSDYNVKMAIIGSLKSNKIDAASILDAQPGQRIMTANYYDETGNTLRSCPNVGSNCPASELAKVRYIRVDIKGEQPTYFARVVGQNEFPVGADAWAARGVCTTIYPIGVRASELTATGFKNPDSGSNGKFTAGNYVNKTAKTLTLYKPTSLPNGNFAWLRWTSSSDAAAMLSGFGNITEGYREANWPADYKEKAPTGYPILPGQISTGDWVLGNSVSNTTAVRNALDAKKFVAGKDVQVLTLPIWEASAGSDANATYRVARLGAFALLNYDLSAQTMRLAYLGDAPECSTLREPANPPQHQTIVGQVQYQPRYTDRALNGVPVQYEIVLDVSGSMSWNYEGKAHKNGTGSVIQCAGTSNCSASDYWKTTSERRIYIARQAINAFIDQMKEEDVIRLVTYSGQLSKPYSESRAINELTKVYPSDKWGTARTAAEKQALKTMFQTAGDNGGAYRTSGGTPSVVGLARAVQLFQQAPTTAPSGKAYKRVTIFLTDGVANIKRNGELQSYKSGCNSETPSCNMGGPDMPIDQAVAEANNLKSYSTIYVIAMAGVAKTGLPDIASAPDAPFFSASSKPSDLQQIFESIAEDVELGNCVPAGGTGFVQTISEEEAAPDPAYPIVGYMQLKSANGALIASSPIQVNSSTGLMVYSFDNVGAGDYLLSGWVNAKGPDKKIRTYKVIFNPLTYTNETHISVNVDPLKALNNTITLDTIHLDLMGSVCDA